jgi:glycosyltransferase involved in cell wall biosynthesis
MKRILIISAVFPPEQVTSALMNYDLARELSKKYNVTVLRPYPTRPLGMKFDYDGMKNEPFETILINSYTYPESQLLGRFRESVDFGRKCASYIRKNHKGIIYIYNSAWQLFGESVVAYMAKKYHIPYMVPVQDIYPECLFTKGNKSSLYKRLIMAFLKPIDAYYQRNAAKIRTITDEMGDYLSETRNIPRNRYLIVNNWQNDEDFENISNSSPEDKIRFVFVGSINVHANVEIIIKAFAEAKIPQSELVLYGGGNQKEYCMELVKQMGLENVRFDFVRREQIPLVQSQASVLVFALPNGNGNLCLPSKMTSYMLSGKPILASVDQDSATTRYINEARCGLSVKPDSIMALIEGFKKMAAMSREQLQVFGDNSVKFAHKNLTREINLRKVCDAIETEIQ